MKVVAARKVVLDLNESLLNEDGALVSGHVSVTGGALFDDDERLLALCSGFLTQSAREESLSIKSVETYGKNLGYAHQYLKSRREFATTLSDEAFLEVSRSMLAEYMAHMLEDEELSSKTVRNRDATLLSFIDGYLCGPTFRGPALRADNPYQQGLISPSPKRNLVIPCSLSELQTLMFCSEYERERCVLQFIFDAGVRRSELPRVTLHAIKKALDFQRHQFITNSDAPPLHTDYCPLEIAGSKGRSNQGKPRYSIVSRATLLRLQRYHSSALYRKHARKFKSDEQTPAFLNAHGEAYTANSVSKLLERLSNRAVRKLLLKKPISPHKLRHGYAYAILRSPDLGADYAERLYIASKSLGHNELSTTEIYTMVPFDIYSRINGSIEEVTTRAQEMQALSDATRLKIGLGDKK